MTPTIPSGSRWGAALVAVALSGCVDAADDEPLAAEEPTTERAEPTARAERAERIDGRVTAHEIPVAARVFVAATDANAAIASRPVRRAGESALARFAAADRERRARGASLEVVDARWVRDVGPSADGRELVQEWKVTRVLDGAVEGLRPGEVFVLAQRGADGGLHSCNGIHGLEGRRAILILELGKHDGDGRVSARLVEDSAGDVGVLYPRDDASWVWAHGTALDEPALLTEVSTWR